MTPIGQPGQPEAKFRKKVKIYFGNFQNFYWPKTTPGSP